MIAAEYITRYPSLFLNKDYSGLKIFTNNELWKTNKHLNKVLADCIDQNLFLNEKFFKLIFLLKLFKIEPDHSVQIIKSKMHICFRDEFSAIKTENVWMDYYLLSERPGIGPFIISYDEKVEVSSEFISFLSLFGLNLNTFIENLASDKREYFNINDKQQKQLIKDEYIKRCENVLLFFKESRDNLADHYHIRLEVIENQLFLNIPNKGLLKYSEVIQRKNPPKEWSIISGYDLSGDYSYDISLKVSSFPEQTKKLWNYYSFFVERSLHLDSLKSLNDLYSYERLFIMLKNDYFNINLNKLSIFLRNVVLEKQTNIIPKKPKNLTELETSLMILQLKDGDFVNYVYPQALIKLDGSTYGDYVVFIPKNRKDLINVAKIMKNCLFEFTWDSKISQNKEFIIILLKNNKPEIAVSFNKEGDLTEALKRYNKEIDDFFKFEILVSLIPSLK